MKLTHSREWEVKDDVMVLPLLAFVDAEVHVTRPSLALVEQAPS
jgi:hypothetical protein